MRWKFCSFYAIAAAATQQGWSKCSSYCDSLNLKCALHQNSEEKSDISTEGFGIYSYSLLSSKIIFSPNPVLVSYVRENIFLSGGLPLELGSHFESKWLNPTILTEREGHCMKSELSSPEICCSLTLKWTPHCSSSSSYWSKALAAASTPPPRDAICANLCKGPLYHHLNTIVQHHWQRREWFVLL